MSVTNAISGIILIGGMLALHADALRRDSDDIDIPGFAEVEPDADESPGTLENSSAESDNFNVGASLVGERGHLGFSIGYLDNNYGVPGAHGHHEEGEDEDHDEEEEGGGTRIDIEQTRYDLAGSYDIERAGNLKSMFFGGEGLFLATLQGTGRVWLQSLPFSRLADRVISASSMTSGRSSNQGENSLGGAILGSILDG